MRCTKDNENVRMDLDSFEFRINRRSPLKLSV